MDNDLISQPMKAYVAYDVYSPEPYQTIVFARSRSEAKVQALKTESCEDAEYIGIRVHREPKADALYKGRSEIDWYDPETRLTLVRDMDWSCMETSEECKTCPARDYCPRLEDESDGW